MVAKAGGWLALMALVMMIGVPAIGQEVGSIRGMVYDADFDVPLGEVKVLIADTGQEAVSGSFGNYVLNAVEPGTYTLVFARPGYTRQVRGDVVVLPGQVTEIDATLAGDFTDMEEFIAQDIQIGGGTEAGLLALRARSPGLVDSISAQLMSQAGAGDAAAALKLVTGATVQDGKFAVIRGLPDRFVSSQLNGVRLPSADQDTRAVELDQFPSSVIESVQVSKTFTPDQQGEASGGAVNVILKGIPDENLFEISFGTKYNSQLRYRDDFLTYRGGGVNFLGRDDGGRDILQGPFPRDDDDTAGVSRGDAPLNYDFGMTLGLRHGFDNGVTVGGFANVFYERDSSFVDNKIDRSSWLSFGTFGPRISGDPGDRRSELFDITQGSEEAKLGGLAVLGMETEDHALTLTYLYTRTATDTATLTEDTSGKFLEYPDHDPTDPNSDGADEPSDLPFLRFETLAYEERTTQSIQLRGDHTISQAGTRSLGDMVTFLPPVVDWTLSMNEATRYEPDKRQFGQRWSVPREPFPILLPGLITGGFATEKAAANINAGGFNRTWTEIIEEGQQLSLNLRLPFEQWSGSEGYLKFGLFADSVDRTYDQESFRFTGVATFLADFDEFWSAVFPSEDRPIISATDDIDYNGTQEVQAAYWMVDLPVTTYLNLIGGVRYESTEIGITNLPEPSTTTVVYLPPTYAPLNLVGNTQFANVQFSQDDVLPSIGMVLRPNDVLTLRASYTETVARQTFRELSAIPQQEFFGADVFIGNPSLKMAALRNYDVRVDYKPSAGALLSASLFRKDVDDPIEYVQRVTGDGSFDFTTPVNYTEGRIEGVELEIRQNLGDVWEDLAGLSIGGNATFIQSEVTLPDDELALLTTALGNSGTGPAKRTRDMRQAPEYLYNLFVTYELEATGTQIGLFYTVKGDTLVLGAGNVDNSFVPSVYAEERDTLNLIISQKLGEHFKLKFSAKNLTDPDIREVYRSPFIPGDSVRSSYTEGIDLSLSVSAEFKF